MSNELKELLVKTGFFVIGLISFIAFGILLMMLITLIQYNDSIYYGAIGFVCMAFVGSIYVGYLCFKKVLEAPKKNQ